MNIPQHIAIIMDGNGRWARERGLPRSIGHREGSKRIKETIKDAKSLGVKIVTVFAFSTENWNRPKKEINLLFSYLKDFLHKYKDELIRDDIKLNIIGRRDRLVTDVIKKIEEVEGLTRENKSFIFNIAIDYGGKWDIVAAAKKIAIDYKDGKISENQIDEDTFGKYLVLGDMPDPELLIRTSGEERISNFLLWNLAYAEFYFPKIYWPDFNKNELIKAIRVYSSRDRRFGKVHA
ncbi:MAG: isoprenyl transferase [Candidatus Omnitrophota bacterium]|jgi:undecaprenyl diphosphate synthase